jgi:hypothetical protein
VVSPGRHVCGRLTPHHHVVEVLVNDLLPMIVAICKVPIDQDERRIVGRDLALDRSDPVVAARITDVGDDRKSEVTGRCGRENVVGTPAD